MPKHPTIPHTPTIGVFDSGFGGLTVLRALLHRIPNAHYLYLGDTARLPYGAKSQQTIARYAVESAHFLAAQGAEHLVIACNTASALAMPELVAAVPFPVTGVIAPVVSAAASAGAPHLAIETWDATPSPPEVLVLATTATVQSAAYTRTCAALRLQAYEKACPLLVPLIEEGWTDHPVTRDVLRIYLREALETCSPQVVILGCTHYPLIAPLITQTLHELGSNATVIDSAEATAQLVASQFATPTTPPTAPSFTCFATDSTEKFARLGSHFLNLPIPQVHLIDLGG